MAPAARTPSATYRLQFGPSFSFRDARALVPYLKRLGISDLYASPIFRARPRSFHGYDIVDPTALNPELGTPEEFDALAAELRAHGMGLLLDIVPNHMAAGPENPWWADVLERGASSPFARYFDIDFDAAGGKLVLPLLGAPYEDALARGELQLELREDGLAFRYVQAWLPLAPSSYRGVLAPEGAPGALEALLARIERGADGLAGRRAPRSSLWDLYRSDAAVRGRVDGRLRAVNGDRAALDRVLSAQAYRLAFWRDGIAALNYRRFFDISGLAALRVEDEEVFEATHALVFRLLREGKVTGLRVDHVDGLRDPAGYLERLRARCDQEAPDCYIVVEKVLTGDERLPEGWPVEGTTGYDFLHAVNGPYVDASGLERLGAAYTATTGIDRAFDAVVYEQKLRVAHELFPSELRSLARGLRALAAHTRPAPDLDEEAWVRAVAEVSARLPVYRTYTRSSEVAERDRAYIAEALEQARGAADARALAVLERVLLLDAPEDAAGAWLDWVMRWQQFTGPLTAKGLEDTALYLHNRLVSLNEVGAGPAATGALEPGAFHRRMRERAAGTMNATSTHDTKRGEDVRARIDALSELADEWTERVGRWRAWNAGRRRRAGDREVLDPNEEWLFYQTLAGAWPLHSTELPEFVERVQAYMVKAAREAKTNTSWLDPDEAYERALTGFVRAALSESSSAFMRDFLEIERRAAFYGMLNALAQLVLKCGAPGVPDFYQGTELWSLTLVDPDNRRPVDFAKRARLLGQLPGPEAVESLFEHWEDGRIKLYVTARLLALRAERPRLFVEGEYLPLATDGAGAGHAVAFARRCDGEWAVFIAPRLVARLSRAGDLPLGAVWDDVRLLLPAGAPGSWTDRLTGQAVDAEAGALPLARVFSRLPVAVLIGRG